MNDTSPANQQAPSKPRVLHVTESYGGGVAAAIDHYARVTPEFDHFLLRSVREGVYSPTLRSPIFTEVTEMPRSPIGAARAVRAVADRVGAHVIHAHSSLGGAIVRLATRNRPGLRTIVYTPHCFAFERTDISPAKRLLFRLAEQVLSKNTETIAGCSQRETHIAMAFHSRRGAVYLPNAAEDVPSLPLPTARAKATRRVVAGGRFGAQKSPELFADIVRELLKIGPCEAVWVGGDRDNIPSTFEQLPIEVTGWLPREASLEALSSGDVYVHTAAWEGFPMAILEASAMRMPIIARSIPAVDDLSVRWKFDSVAQAVNMIESITSDSTTAQVSANEWARALESNTSSNQATALRAVYKHGTIPSGTSTDYRQEIYT